MSNKATNKVQTQGNNTLRRNTSLSPLEPSDQSSTFSASSSSQRQPMTFSITMRKATSFSNNNPQQQTFEENQSISTWDSPQSLLLSESESISAKYNEQFQQQQPQQQTLQRPKTTYFYKDIKSGNTSISSAGKASLSTSGQTALSPIITADAETDSKVELLADEIKKSFAVTPKASLYRPHDAGIQYYSKPKEYY